MASYSRVVPRWIVALPIIALLSGCSNTGHQAFREVPPGLVEIGSDCKGEPDKAVIDVDTGGGGAVNRRTEILWHLTDQQDGDRVVISSKPAEEQDPKNASRGRAIRNLFQLEYVIPASYNAIRSGPPANAAALLEGPQAQTVVWKYNIEYYRNGKKLCAYDPDICIQRLGSDSCGVTTSASQ